MLKPISYRSWRTYSIILSAAVLLCASLHGSSATAISLNATGSNQGQAQSGDLEEAKRLNGEAVKLYGEGRYAEAIPLAQRALAIYEKALGPDHPDVAISLSNLAELYKAKGDYAKAEPLYQRSLAIKEKALGTEHPDVATTLNNLAQLSYEKGDYAKAEPLFQRALAIREKALGSEHPVVATNLNDLALLYKENGDYAKAEPLYQRALTIREKVFGPDHLYMATPLHNLAQLYYAKGDYAKAEPLYQRALTIRGKELGPHHPDVGNSLNDLAELFFVKGDYVRAEPLYQRALTIREKELGLEHTDVASVLGNLARLYETKGDYAKAELLYQRALAILEKALGPEHLYVATTLNNLAELFFVKGDYVRAEPLYQRALTIREKELGLEHTDVASVLDNLARLYETKGDYAKAELLYQRALAIEENIYGPNRPEVAITINNLAALYLLQGNYAKAEPLCQRTLAIREKALGPDHPDVAVSLDNLAVLYQASGNIKQAIAFLIRSNEIRERNIALNLATGSERQKLLYLATFSGNTDATISIHVQSAANDPAARRLALLTVLRRKGRALDAMTDILSILRRRSNPQDQRLLDQLADTRSRLATFVLGGPGETDPAQHRAEIGRLEGEEERLESQISARRAEFRAQSQPVTLEAVQAAIPQGSALIEFVSFYPFNAKDSINRWGERRYVAYVLGNQGEAAWVDLGDAIAIDIAVDELRAVLRKVEDKPLSDIESEVKPLARAVEEMVMRPVRKLLGQTRSLLLSPDGALNLIPFGALVDEQNHYLVEQYHITYLTSGRDLLRMQTRTDNRQGAMIIANPDFGGNLSFCNDRALKINKEKAQAREAINFSDVFFCPLQGTSGEADALNAILPGAKVMTEDQATEAALKQTSRPSILHIATHGFFLEDIVTGPPQADTRGLLVRVSYASAPEPTPMRVENPLLRSGLALAGANLRQSGVDDGVLTALEVAGLNLWGTKLVVLSACETGIGEVRNGEGVYGLRRALVLAGSETQVMSLWKVSDNGTRDLMIEYYKGLQAGQGRAEAMREVQLRMIANEDSKGRRHPYYWASFIQSGEWANMEGKR